MVAKRLDPFFKWLKPLNRFQIVVILNLIDDMFKRFIIFEKYSHLTKSGKKPHNFNNMMYMDDYITKLQPIK